jgi:hypothetical protein
LFKSPVALAVAEFVVMAGETIWRIDDMDKIPSLNKKIVNIASLDDIEEEKKYWFSKSPLERIEAIEINRRMIYGSVLLGEEYVR